MIEILKIILTGIIASGGAYLANFIFYKKIKGDVDKDIERHKISYSGLYKEKIDIYRALLNDVAEMKLKTSYFSHDPDPKIGNEINLMNNDLYRKLKINRPFISLTVVKDFEILAKEIHSCFEIFQNFYRKLEVEDLIHDSTKQLPLEFLDAQEKLDSKNLVGIENKIIEQMKKDLNFIE